MNRKMRIKNRIVFYFSIILVISLLVSTALSNQLCKSMIETNAMRNLEALVSEATDKVNIVLKQKIQPLEQIAQLDVMRDLDETVETKLMHLKKFEAILDYKDLAWIDTKGNMYTLSGTTKNIAEFSFFKKVLTGETTLSPGKKIGQERVFAIGVPILDTQYNVIGILMAIESVEKIDVAFEHTKETDEYMLLDSKGSILQHSNKQVIESQIQMNQMPKYEAFNDAYKLYKQMLAGERGVRIYKKSESGKQSYVSYAPVGFGWSLALVDHKDKVMNVMHHFNIQMIFNMAVIALIGIWIVYYVAKKLSEKMGKITSYLDVVASGAFDQPIPEELLELGDEMGDMARALNSMKAEIEDMLGTVRQCTDYMNEQMEDFTEDIKGALKEAIIQEESQLEEEKREEVIQRLQILNHIKEHLLEFDSPKKKVK